MHAPIFSQGSLMSPTCTDWNSSLTSVTLFPLFVGSTIEGRTCWWPLTSCLTNLTLWILNCYNMTFHRSLPLLSFCSRLWFSCAFVFLATKKLFKTAISLLRRWPSICSTWWLLQVLHGVTWYISSTGFASVGPGRQRLYVACQAQALIKTTAWLLYVAIFITFNFATELFTLLISVVSRQILVPSVRDVAKHL